MTDFINQMRLDGRVAIVTGGGSGIGRATCRALAQAGAIVAVTDIDGAAAEAVAQDIWSNAAPAEAHVMDITWDKQVDETVARIFDAHRRIDILVNNAGISLRHPATETSTADRGRVMDVNLNGHFYCARAVGRHMVAAGSGARTRVSMSRRCLTGSRRASSGERASRVSRRSAASDRARPVDNAKCV